MRRQAHTNQALSGDSHLSLRPLPTTGAKGVREQGQDHTLFEDFTHLG